MEAALAAFQEGFLLRLDLLTHRGSVLHEEAGVLPVSMGEEHYGRLALDVLGAIQVAGDEEPGSTFEVDLFNGVFTAIDLAVDDGVEGRARGHR